MFDACPVHPKGTMVIPMLWRISEYVVCMMGVKNQNHHTHPYTRARAARNNPKCEEARGRDYSRERNHKIFEEGGAGGIPVKGGMLDPGVTGPSGR